MTEPLVITRSPGSSGARGLRVVADPPPGPFPATLPGRMHLVGRDADAERVLAVIADGHRLITVTGPGGVGKTRLATEIGHRTLHQFAGAVLYVPLELTTDATTAIAAIAARAGWEVTDEAAVGDTVRAELARRPTLVVLDNCEQIADLGAAVHDLLTACPDLVVVATSRRPLGLAAERLVELGPLQVPAPDDAVRAIAESEAVTVLVAAARLRTPDFAVTAANAADLARLCDQLDGLPLALELAAARLHLVTPGEMTGLLERRFDLLAHDAPDRSPHHRRLYATIDWSYQLLDADDRRCFDMLGVFAGGFTLDAAAAVAGTDTLTMLATVDRLVDHHLVHPLNSAGAERRFDLFESIREFARTQLVDGGRLADARDAHAQWAIATAEEWGAAFTDGARQLAATDVFGAERANFRAALGHLVEGGPGGAAQRLATAHWRYWISHGAIAEGVRWLTAALGDEAVGDTAGRPADPVRAAALQALGDLTEVGGDLPRASALLGRAAAMYTELGDTVRLASVWNSVGFVERELGDLDTAEQHHRNALAVFTDVGDRRSQAVSLNGLGVIAWRRGDYPTAAEHYAETLTRLSELGDRFAEVLVTGNLGTARERGGDLDGALAAHRHALELAEQPGESTAIMNALLNIANIEIKRGELAEAEAALTRAEAIAAELGSKHARMHALFHRGEITAHRGQLGDALGLHVAGLALTAELSRMFDVAEALERIGVLLAELGDRALAARTLDVTLAGRAATGTSADAMVDECRAALTAAGFPPPDGGAAWPDDVGALVAGLVRAAPAHAGARRRGLATHDPLREVGLTPREADVARLVVAHRTDAEIAAELYIGIRTVATHVSSVLRKLGVSSRRDVAGRLGELGIEL